MSERDFEVDGRKFKLNKIDTFKQFHIARKLSPVLSEVIPLFQKISKIKTEGLSEEAKFEAIVSTGGISKIMECVANLSEEDSEKVLKGLCSAVEMQQSQGNWARVVVGNVLAFEDLGLPTLLQIAGRSFAYNMADFFRIAPQTSHGG